MNGFTEATLEQVIVDAIKAKGYVYVHGDNIPREYEDVLIEDDLRMFLMRRYTANGITKPEIDQIILSLRSAPASPLYDSNRTMFRKIVEGETFKRFDRT